MNDLSKTLAGCAILVTLGAGCIPGAQTNLPPSDSGKASRVTLTNCTFGNGPTDPPSGRAYNVVTRVEQGPWVSQSQLNSNPPPPVACHDPAHPLQSLTVVLDQPGKWEFRAIKIDVTGACDSTTPDAANACSYVPRSYVQDVEGPVVQWDLTSADQ